MTTQRLKVRNETFTRGSYHPGKSAIVRLLWYFTNALVFNHGLFPVYGLKAKILRMFGAKVGEGLVIKPSVNIKNPWRLTIGNHVWIGENVWIDNLEDVTIGDSVCLSQGSMLLTGNHDYTRSTFDFRNQAIVLEDGVWIGAQAVVCPGITCHSHAILAVSSVATQNLEAYMIYQGNPALKVRERHIKQ